MFFQQFGGVNGILFYASEIFKSAGNLLVRIKSLFRPCFFFYCKKEEEEEERKPKIPSNM